MILTLRQHGRRSVQDLSSLTDFVAWISNDASPPKLVKFCDEETCKLASGDEWDQIRTRFAPIAIDETQMSKEIDDLVAYNE